MPENIEPFAPAFPEYARFQVGIRLPVVGLVVWLPAPRRWFRNRVAKFIAPGSSMANLLVGMAHANGLWVLRDNRFLYRIINS